MATETVSVRMTKEQCEKLKKMAKAAGSTESWVLRALVDNSQLVSGAIFVGATTLVQHQHSEVKDG